MLIFLYGNNIKEILDKENQALFCAEEEIIDQDLPVLVKKFKNKASKKHYVKTVILNYRELEVKEDLHPNILACCSRGGISGCKIKEDVIIIHVHGGGFIGGNTFMEENILREWSSKLKVPVTGIDYRVAPGHKYPSSLDDVYQAYMWLIENSAVCLGVKPKKIIMTGDSAGGTLILTLTFLLITLNKYLNKSIKLPDLLIPFYPCCNTSLENMSLSLPLCYDDLLLNYENLKYISESYRGTYKNNLDPFLNPQTANEKLLKHLPPTVFFIGSQDPLRDDTVRLMHNLSKIKRASFKCYEFKYYPHAFLNSSNREIKEITDEIFFYEVRNFLKEHDWEYK